MLISNWIVTKYRSNKITGNYGCTLMEQLVKGVLVIGSRFIPYYRTGRVSYSLSIAIAG